MHITIYFKTELKYLFYPTNKMEVMTKNKLHELMSNRLKKLDSEIVDTIARLVYGQVISKVTAGDGTMLVWDVSTGYIFEGGQHIRQVHLVKACQKLQELFPDSIITHTQSQQIVVNWA